MTRRNRPEGRSAGVGTPSKSSTSTRRAGTPSGAYIRISGDADQAAAELVEKVGPGFAASMALAIAELAEVNRT